MRQLVRWKTRWLGWLPSLILLAGVCGCDNTAKVTGKVTYQGRPVRYGSVIFLSADKTARSGVIEPDGSFTVEGVPRGAAKIAVISRNPATGRSVVRDGMRVRPDKIGPWFPLPPQYESPATAGLSCTIDSSRLRYDIDLK